MTREQEEREEQERQERPRVRFTDKRRVRPDEERATAHGPVQPPRVEAGGEPSLGVAEPADRSAELETEVEAARREAAEYKEQMQRLAAEFANYRKRVMKEQTHAVERASEPLMARLLEVLDEFDLALMAAEQRPDFDKFLRGVELVYAKLSDILRAEGLQPIDAKGKPFDPELHEALMQSGDGDGEPVVADVLRRGYTVRGRGIRPAGVKVVRK